MSYWGFHLRFNAPILLVLGWLAWPGWTWMDSLWTAVVCLIVVCFTAPWDNWAVACRIWDFPEDRIAFRIWYCPIEEYAFFVIQTIEGCLLCDFLAEQMVGVGKSPPDWQLTGWLFVGWIVAAVIWARRPPVPRRGMYLWHLLFWMAPIVAIHWSLGGLWVGNLAAVLGTTMALGTVLSVADIVAIRAGIWFFDESQTLGVRLGGVLPVEEAIFFYLTSLLVAQSFLLFR